jgi:tetratricopeptide (TPR) repeat protein
MHLHLLATGFILAIAIAPAHAAKTPWGSWEQAKSLFDSGKYEEALESLKSHPSDEASYFYNLGTIYNKIGRVGTGVAYLEKANRLEPHDPAIQRNLSLARVELGRLIGHDHLDPASTWSERIADQVSLDEIRSTLGLLGSITLILWIRAYLRTRRLRKTLLQPAGVCAFIGFLITAGLYAMDRMAEAHPPAICIERQVVRSGPGNHFLELSQVEAGAKLRVLGPEAAAEGAPTEQWRQVRFSQDGIGWVRVASLLLL